MVKEKSITDINVHKKEDLERPGAFRSYTDAEKRKLEAYLTRTPCAYTTQPVIDLFTGEETNVINNLIIEGAYRWYEGQVYYFKKYNLRLNQDFIDHVMASE